MNLGDLNFEVRDKALRRVGVIKPEYLDCKFSVIYNNVGDWELSLPANHPLAEDLRTPGSGLIVSNNDGDTLMSGPMVRARLDNTPLNPLGSWLFSGATDDIHIADRFALPVPTRPVREQGATTSGHDRRAGSVERVMYGYVRDNLGPGAIAERRVPNLVMAPDQNRGPTTLYSARYDPLGEMLFNIARRGRLRFGIRQVDDHLLYETSERRDLTQTVRLDVRNGTLAASRLTVQAPGLTQVIVAGAGKSFSREVRQYDNANSRAAVSDWGRRIEFWIDQRQAQGDTLAEREEVYLEAADEALMDSGFSVVDVEVVPQETNTMNFMEDWFIGDSVSVVVDGQELTSLVTGYNVRADKDGYRLGVSIGNPTDYDARGALRRQVARQKARLDALERD